MLNSWSIQSQLLSLGFQIWWHWTMWTLVSIVNPNLKTEFIWLYIGVVGKGTPWTICNTDWRLNGIDCEFQWILWWGKKSYISWLKQLPSSPVPQCLQVLPIHLSLFTRTSIGMMGWSLRVILLIKTLSENAGRCHSRWCAGENATEAHQQNSDFDWGAWRSLKLFQVALKHFFFYDWKRCVET